MVTATRSLRNSGLEGWLRYQSSLNPQKIDLGLDRLRPVAQRMNLTAGKLAVITVAGTNGKGSTVAFIESLAKCHGLSVASYTSPWLLRFNESVRVNGEAVDDQSLIDAFERVEAARIGVPLTEFEFRTLAGAHIAFAHKPDVVVLEVGLGGRLDAVNLFDATVAVITSIALDHQQWLGDTHTQIAREKAGIARADAPLICADPHCSELLEPLAVAAGAVPWLAQLDYHFGAGVSQMQGAADGARWCYRGNGLEFVALPMPALSGKHQLANAAAAMTALSLIAGIELDEQCTARALRDVTLAGRVQKLPAAPLRFVDVAHNQQASAALADWMSKRDSGPVAALCAMYADKDLSATMRALREVVRSWHVAPLPPPRGASAQSLADVVMQFAPHSKVTIHDSVEQGWRAACQQALQGGCALGFGSFETVRAILRLESASSRLDT